MVLLSVFFLLTGPYLMSVRAANNDETVRDLNTLKREIRENRRLTKRARLRRGSLLKEIDDLSRWHNALQQDLEKLAADKENAQLQVEKQKLKTARLEKDLAEIREKFCRRLKIRYCQPRGKWLDFLGGDADLTENLNSLVYTRRVLEADRKLQNSYLSLLAEIKKHNLELEKRLRFLAHLERQQADKMATLEENIAKKNDLLYKIRHQVKEHEELVAELEAVASRLKRMTCKTGLGKSGFAELKGSLPMPVAGVVVSFFGIEKDIRFATATRNKGIEIECKSGTPVKVVYKGEVAFADWMKGYGNLLVVDHGGGYHTVYAHLDKFTCKVHDQLQSADVVGGVGSGVFSDTPSLYFEIRKDGIPQDPLVWIKQL